MPIDFDNLAAAFQSIGAGFSGDPERMQLAQTSIQNLQRKRRLGDTMSALQEWAQTQAPHQTATASVLQPGALDGIFGKAEDAFAPGAASFTPTPTPAIAPAPAARDPRQAAAIGLVTRLKDPETFMGMFPSLLPDIVGPGPKAPIALGEGGKLIDPNNFTTLASNPKNEAPPVQEFFDTEGKPYKAQWVNGSWMKFGGSKASEEPLQEIADDTSPTGRRLVPRAQAVGKPGPSNVPQQPLTLIENNLRDDFKTTVQPYVALRDAHAKVMASAKSETAAGDMALIYGYMKMLDPTSTVREGEYATAEQARGIAGSVLQRYNKLVDGEKLTPDQRADFVSRVNDIMGSQKPLYESARNRFRDIAKRSGVNPDNVAPAEGLQIAEPITLSAPPAAIAALKSDPTKAGEFDAYYGKGSAAKVLGKK